MKLRISFVFAAILVAACTSERVETPIDDLDFLATEYLMLELSMGLHDGAHVDAYFGPEEIRAEAQSAALSLAEIESRAALLEHRLRNWGGESGDAQAADDMQSARIDSLVQRLQALHTRIALNRGETLPFDEESRRLFGVSAPDHDAAHFEAILEDIDALLEGEGDLSGRVNRFREQFVIPPDRISAVFDAAIAECRRRTLLFIELPENESFVEKNLVQDRGWTEFSLYPLFSPQSLIAEGSGNYGIELAFPGDERVEFEREVLFPLAGLDPSEADRYYELLELLGRLEYAGNEAARDYLNGEIDREQAAQWLQDYSLSSPERAQQRVDFFDTYRSYVINYNLGKDMVRDYVERDTQDHAARWQKFERMLWSPMSTTDLYE
jgi:hypothetical protein